AGARAVPHQRERAGRAAGGARPGPGGHGEPPAPRHGHPGHRGQLRAHARPRGRGHRARDGGRDDHRSPRPEGPRQARRGKATAAHARPPRGPGATDQMSARTPLSFWQIWNMAFGFLGIQFGWALQMANMSAIYEYLGADAHQIPMLWLAAPLTGLLVQPMVGHMSARTWSRLGRRRPYFLVGALLASFALIAMPNSSGLWMAAGLLWLPGASINISMEPFRAFVADLLPPAQRTRGFSMQALFIGLGAVIASMLPWLLYNVFTVGGDGGAHSIPLTVTLAFYTGAFVFLAAVVWTVVTTREHPPDDMKAFKMMQAEKAGIVAGASAIFHHVIAMPQTMRRLAWVQIFTWLGLFCMCLYFGVAVARNVFGGTPGTPAYEQGIAWGGNCFAMYSFVCFLVSFALP